MEVKFVDTIPVRTTIGKPNPELVAAIEQIKANPNVWAEVESNVPSAAANRAAGSFRARGLEAAVRSTGERGTSNLYVRYVPPTQTSTPV